PQYQKAGNDSGLMRIQSNEIIGLANLITLEGGWEATARKHTCLLGWNCGELPVDYLADNGSCCLLQTARIRFLVTCAHVWVGFETFRDKHTNARLWLSLLADDRSF